MVKRIKFPLEFNERKARDLEELKSNFDMDLLFEYFENGKLTVWLQDRGLDEIKYKLEGIFPAYPDSVKGLCEA